MAGGIRGLKPASIVGVDGMAEAMPLHFFLAADEFFRWPTQANGGLEMGHPGFSQAHSSQRRA